MSEYRLQITRADDGAKVRLVPGGKQERDFAKEIVVAFVDKLPTDHMLDALAKKGVGVFRSEAQVRRAMRQVLTDVARPQLEQAILDAVRDVFRHAKNEVDP